MGSIREGDLVVMSDKTDMNDGGETGIVLKIRKREIASPHPNYRGKHPPIELKVVETVEVLWSQGVQVVVAGKEDEGRRQ